MLNIQDLDDLLLNIEDGILEKGIEEFNKKRIGKQSDSTDAIVHVMMLECIKEDIDSDENKEILVSYLQNIYKVKQNIPFITRNDNF